MSDRVLSIERALQHQQFYDGDIGADLRWLLAQHHELLSALKAITETGDDCPACDRGVLRHPENGHWPNCPFGRAQAVIAEQEARS